MSFEKGEPVIKRKEDNEGEELVPSGEITASDPETAAMRMITKKEFQEKEKIKFNTILENNTYPEAKKIKNRLIMLLDRIENTSDSRDGHSLLIKELNIVIQDKSGNNEGLYGKSMNVLREFISRIDDPFYGTKMTGQETPLNVKQEIKQTVEKYLENIFGINRFNKIKPGEDNFDMDRMESSDVEKTSDPELDGKVAEVYSDSFEYSPDMVQHYRDTFLPKQEEERKKLISEAEVLLKEGKNGEYAEKIQVAKELEKNLRIDGIGLHSDAPQIVRPARVKVYNLKK